MYNDEQQQPYNLQKTYKLVASASGFFCVLGASTALTIITRLLPVTIPGGLFVQGTLLASTGFYLVISKEPLQQLISGAIAGAVFFSLLGGWWDAFYLWLAAINLGGITGFHLFMMMIVFCIGWVIDSQFKAGK